MKRSKVALAAIIVSIGFLLLGVFSFITISSDIGKEAFLETPGYTEEVYDLSLLLMKIALPGQFICIVFGLMGYLKNNVGFIIVALVLSISAFLLFGLLSIPQIVLFAVAISKVKQCKLDEEMRNYEDEGVVL